MGNVPAAILAQVASIARNVGLCGYAVPDVAMRFVSGGAVFSLDGICAFYGLIGPFVRCLALRFVPFLGSLIAKVAIYLGYISLPRWLL